MQWPFGYQVNLKGIIQVDFVFQIFSFEKNTFQQMFLPLVDLKRIPRLIAVIQNIKVLGLLECLAVLLQAIQLALTCTSG